LVGDSAVDYATWHAARVRLTEDWLGVSQAEQYVILGAGFDSFAWRHTGAIETHEFDHPSLLEAGGFGVEEDRGALDVTDRYGLPCIS